VTGELPHKTADDSRLKNTVVYPYKLPDILRRF
jgi:hypothetical protein